MPLGAVQDGGEGVTDREKVIAAYICSNKKPPDKRCEKCPYGYEYLDQTGDDYFVCCNTARIMVDAIDLLKAQEQEPISASIVDSDGGLMHWWACGNCQAPINPEDKFCHECGRKVKWDD